MARGKGPLECLSDFFLSIVRCLCGFGPSGERGEREELLADQVEELSDARQQLMVVLRHGHRMDEGDDGWVGRAERPWDPPLSPEGVSQAIKAGSVLSGFHFDHLVTSPYQRCLQTSSQILSQLGLTLDNLLIDCQLGEIFNPRVMNGGQEGLPKGPLEKWMWKGKSLSDAMKEFIMAEPSLQHMPGCPVLLHVPLPSEVETIGEAHRRYATELERLGDIYSGANLLVVTHGECIRVAVNSILPNAIVYESRHTGFVCKCRSPLRRPIQSSQSGYLAESALWGGWRLITVSNTTGVSWHI